MHKLVLPVLAAVLLLALNPAHGAQSSWIGKLLAVPYPKADVPREPVFQLVRQDHEKLQLDRSILNTPLRIGSRSFERGLGTHSVSHVRVYSPVPIERFSAWIGVDHNERTAGGGGSVVFSVAAGGRELYRSGVMRGVQEPVKVDVEPGGARQLDLRVDNAGDGPSCDHADWADATITLEGGKSVLLSELKVGVLDLTSRYPFSFVYDGKSSDDFLETWRKEVRSEAPSEGRTKSVTTWSDSSTGLRVHWEVTRFADYPALDWVLYFENAGTSDTKIVQDIKALDVVLRSPLSAEVPYRLHRTHGGTPDPVQFEPSELVIDETKPVSLDAGHGRSSGKDFPFFKIETGEGSLIAAIGWSGFWKADFVSPDRRQLHVTAGLDPTHFLLHPGEKVRMPRMLLLHWDGDTLESNAQFRQLIYKHYAARWNGKTPEPILFCNTCFTRGGGWLNECNADNQISLIKAYAPLGLEALLTDAGWFTGGWPDGAGNWDPRKDAYPDGMGPVAAAAKQQGMIYGLWYEPERVIHGTTVQREHPEWCLGAQAGEQHTYLLNFGLPEVQDYFFDIVKGFMDLPGFRVYRQDFNMDPRPYWLYNDAPDRQGITEIRYIEGLYAFWDRLAATWPDSLREECASGGHRIDLETVMRLHIHQKTDYWFDNDVDQAAIWGLNQYLPNNTIVAHLVRQDDYSFHSTMASSLCMGWIADAPDFDVERGKELLKRYREVRHLLVGAAYPLLPYTRDPRQWMATQYHRPDLDKGMVLVFRHAESPYSTADVALHGLDARATYELVSDSTGRKVRATGAELMKDTALTVPEKHRSDLIVYRKVSR